MFGTVAEVGERFVAHLRPHAESCADVDVYDLLARFLTEVISSCAFGFESNSLDEPDNQFRVMGGKALNPTKFRSLVMFVAMTFREKARKLGIVFNTAEMNSFFMSLVSDTIEHRKSSGARRNDFMQLMMELMERDDENGERLSFNEVAAQAFIFYVAGFETSSTVLAFALYSLALDRDIQAKARNHVRAVLEKFDGKWSYEAVMEMTYVEQIIEETLRLYPPVATLHRMTTREYTLPNGSKIPKETGVIIPILAIQRDPQHFPDPLKFDPDRFSAENKTKRHPFASIPFGEGPRYCIGMRFGQLQSRLSLAMLLKNFEFEPCDKTEYPIKIDTIKLTHCPKGEVRLRIRKA